MKKLIAAAAVSLALAGTGAHADPQPGGCAGTTPGGVFVYGSCTFTFLGNDLQVTGSATGPWYVTVDAWVTDQNGATLLACTSDYAFQAANCLNQSSVNVQIGAVLTCHVAGQTAYGPTYGVRAQYACASNL